MAFVDYEEVFDCTNTSSIRSYLTARKKKGCCNILEEIYDGAAASCSIQKPIKYQIHYMVKC